MRLTKKRKNHSALSLVQAKQEPFFSKERKGSLFSESKENTSPFFTSNIDNTLQKKDNLSQNIIQRQDEPDQTVTRDRRGQGGSRSERGSSRANRCYTNPESPDFRCLAYALKLDIDENLWNNAHHFYRIASLYPNNNELMWNTFLRYGLGINLLQTSFGFLGANETLGTALSYGTGIGLKSYEFFQNGQLQLDIPIPLRRGINLDLQFDLNANPDNLREIRGVSGGVGFSGHF